MMPPSALRSVLAASVLAGLLLVGCDTALEPFADDNGAYSVRGVLSLTKSEHYIRVNDLNRPATQDTAHRLDATVTLANPSAGITETLEDSVVVFEGTATHNFRVTQAIQPDTEYRLAVERADGVTTRASAITPPLTEVDVDPAATTVACDRETILRFRNVPEPRLIRVRVGVEWNGQQEWISSRPVKDSSGTPTHFVSAAGVLAEVVPQPTLDDLPGVWAYCTLLSDPTLQIAYTHLGPDWPADSVRADPLASDVENGLGLFGGVHRDTLRKTVVVDDS